MHSIEIVYTIPGQREKVRPFYSRKRAAEQFMIKLLKAYPKAQVKLTYSDY